MVALAFLTPSGPVTVVAQGVTVEVRLCDVLESPTAALKAG